MTRCVGVCNRPTPNGRRCSSDGEAAALTEPAALGDSAKADREFSKLILAKLQDRRSGFAQDYLRAVVDQIVVKGKTATISGSNARLVEAVSAKELATSALPSSMRDWRAQSGESAHWTNEVRLIPRTHSG